MNIRHFWQAVAAGAAAALAAGMAMAPAAHAATTYTDTSLQAFAPAETAISGTIADANASAATVQVSGLTGSGAITWTGSAVINGVTVSANSAGLLSGTGTAGGGSDNGTVTLDATDTAGDVAVAAVPVTVATGSVQKNGSPSADLIALNPPVNNNGTGAVVFSTTPGGGTVTQANLPAGLLSGNPLVPGSAIPGTYNDITAQARDAGGAIANGRFDLKVNGHKVVTAVPGNLGDEVNGFGNGFDVYQQHWAYGAHIVGWTATRGDPATHFVRIPRGSAWQFEAVNASGIATGLCVSDPDDPSAALPDGLVLRGCNSGPWQQFTLVTAEPSQLRNVATGLLVWPDGTGAQLRGSLAVIPGADNHYTWKDRAHLP